MTNASSQTASSLGDDFLRALREIGEHLHRLGMNVDLPIAANDSTTLAFHPPVAHEKGARHPVALSAAPPDAGTVDSLESEAGSRSPRSSVGSGRVPGNLCLAVYSPAVKVDEQLPRKLGRADGALFFVGAVLGSGIFVVPSLIARHVQEPGLVLAIWLVSGFLVLAGALALAELGAMLPHSGGRYVYVREAYGPFFAFSTAGR